MTELEMVGWVRDGWQGIELVGWLSGLELVGRVREQLLELVGWVRGLELVGRVREHLGDSGLCGLWVELLESRHGLGVELMVGLDW